MSETNFQNSSTILRRNPQHDKHLVQRLGLDAASAFVAGLTVAPVVSIIDRAVTESVSGRESLLGSVRSSLHGFVTHPHKFLSSKQFAIMLLLYGSTYLAANAVDTASSVFRELPASTTSAGLPKFLATSTINLNLSLFKDIQYAKMFGVARPTPFPGPSFAIFIVRDCMTIAASFNLPPIMARHLPTTMDPYVNRAVVAQLAAPALVQVFGSPLHLLGLDLYNRKGARSVSDRWRQVKEAWPRTTVARMCRVLPAFGVGGVVNTRIRQNLMQRYD